MKSVIAITVAFTLASPEDTAYLNGVRDQFAVSCEQAMPNRIAATADPFGPYTRGRDLVAMMLSAALERKTPLYKVCGFVAQQLRKDGVIDLPNW